ncbi:transposase [Mycoplasmatota bacterium]|nr:transposase [Mycoplasmatota bacterium]
MLLHIVNNYFIFYQYHYLFTVFIGEYREAALSIERWLPEIVNSFMIKPDTNTRYTSSFIEGSNNYIKVIKRTSYGFRCFKTFRNKILYNHNNSRHVIFA